MSTTRNRVSSARALKGQTLDKIIYINPTGGLQLKPLSFSVDSATYVRPDGKTPLGDHAPVSPSSDSCPDKADVGKATDNFSNLFRPFQQIGKFRKIIFLKFFQSIDVIFLTLQRK